jgi:hypothetical protein
MDKTEIAQALDEAKLLHEILDDIAQKRGYLLKLRK